MCGGTCWYQKKLSDPLELELQVVMRHPMWVFGTEFELPAKTECVLNFCAISAALKFELL